MWKLRENNLHGSCRHVFGKKQKDLLLTTKSIQEHSFIVEKIREFPALSSFGKAIQGITPYDKYRGQDPELIKRRGYHFDYKKDDTCGKWLSGKMSLAIVCLGVANG